MTTHCGLTYVFSVLILVSESKGYDIIVSKLLLAIVFEAEFQYFSR